MIGALLLATVMVPLCALAPLLILGAFLMQFLVQGARGVAPAHLAELSPDSVRRFLPGFGYQSGVLLASAVTYIEAVFAHRTSYAIAMAGTAATVFLLAAVATAVGPERRAAVFGQ
jgi:SHS family lactate transporter-like MFS transporter